MLRISRGTDPGGWTSAEDADPNTFRRTTDVVTLTALPIVFTKGTLDTHPTGTLTGFIYCGSTAAMT